MLDTQGAEFRILEGAEPILKDFAFVKTEVADFEAYAGCSQLSEIEAFLHAHGFVEEARHCFATAPSIGSYFDIVYRREHSP